MATQKWIAGSLTTLLTTELNSLANDAGVLTAEIDNTSNLDVYADIEYYMAGHGTAPAADTTHDLYIVRSVDATPNYEDYSATRPPAYGSIGSVVLDNTAGAQRKVIPSVLLPPYKFKIYIVNKSGYALAASANTLKMRTYNLQVV